MLQEPPYDISVLVRFESHENVTGCPDATEPADAVKELMTTGLVWGEFTFTVI